MAYQQKTLPDSSLLATFLTGIEPERRRRESAVIIEMLERLSGEKPTLWGPSIVGFGSYAYKYDSGHSGTACRIGFSPRKAALTIYIMSGYDNQSERLLRLGPHTIGKSCLYIKDLSRVDLEVLEQICSQSLAEMNKRYPRKN